MAGHLASGKVNLGRLRDLYRRQLLECLEMCPGSKAVVWDEALTGPVGLIAEYPLLKEHGVEKMFPLTGTLPACMVNHVIYITRPKLSLMDLIDQGVRAEEKQTRSSTKKEFHIFFVPRRSLLCIRKLEELGCFGSFTTVSEFPMNLIPLDADLLSMEDGAVYKDCSLHGDYSSLFNVAQSLMTLQQLYGVIPTLQGKGQCAKRVIALMQKMRKEQISTEEHLTPQFDSLLVIDRAVDVLTPLLSQLTYEGLIDEIWGINNTAVRLPAEKFAQQQSSPAAAAGAPSGGGPAATQAAAFLEPKKVVLNSADELFGEIRDKNFNAVGPVLSKKAKVMSAQYDERHAAKTVSEMKLFVSKLPHMQAEKQSLSLHTSIAELIKDVTSSDEFLEQLHCQQEFLTGGDTDKPHAYLEDLIAKDGTDSKQQESGLLKVLRLLCIQCYCNGGFKPKLLELYKREILQTYGYEHMISLANLERVGLLSTQTQAFSRSLYSTLRKNLRLTIEDVNEQSPTDISYVYSGYAPLAVRLVQLAATRGGWRSAGESLNLLPGDYTEVSQKLPAGLHKRRPSVSSLGSSSVSSGEPRTTLVFFIGGVTFAEISALRFLQSDESSTEYVIATTKIINSRDMLSSLLADASPSTAESSNPFET